jgi:hypothetical protein
VSPEQVKSLEQRGLTPRTFEDKLKVEISKDALPGFIGAFAQQSMEVVAVEPKRVTLEDFFMSFIHQS